MCCKLCCVTAEGRGPLPRELIVLQIVKSLQSGLLNSTAQNGGSLIFTCENTILQIVIKWNDHNYYCAKKYVFLTCWMHSDYFMYLRQAHEFWFFFSLTFIKKWRFWQECCMFPFVTRIMILNITLRTSAETRYIDRCEYQCKKNAA